MRFIVHEQDYEKPIAAGQFRYDLAGRPTGAVETWRLTQATEGYEVLRVDLDARAAVSGHSYLYHLVRRAGSAPERLAYRFWGAGLEIEGTLLFSDTHITGTRTVNGNVYSEDLDVESGTLFWFPSTIGLGLVLDGKVGTSTAVTLNNQVGTNNTLALQPVNLTRSMMITDQVEIKIGRQTALVVPWMLRWQDEVRVISRDGRGWPVQMERQMVDGGMLTAVETRYIWY
ncbi:MAG: hypothetical protein GY796_07560 [Chloroflexi bacterium]|nr:hypothetical protein [Chloroflexota bacterium]